MHSLKGCKTPNQPRALSEDLRPPPFRFAKKRRRAFGVIRYFLSFFSFLQGKIPYPHSLGAANEGEGRGKIVRFRMKAYERTSKEKTDKEKNDTKKEFFMCIMLAHFLDSVLFEKRKKTPSIRRLLLLICRFSRSYKEKSLICGAADQSSASILRNCLMSIIPLESMMKRSL